MKVVIIGQKGIPTRTGGVERHVEELAIRLVERGDEVTVYTRPNYTDEKLKSYKGVKLVSLPVLATKHLDAIGHTFLAVWYTFLKQRKAEVIHFHSIGPSLMIPLMKLLKPRTPIVSTYHSQCYFHQKWGGFARFFLRLGEFFCCCFSDKVITVSRNLKKYTESKYKRNEEDVAYVPNGVPGYEKVSVDMIKKWELEKDGYIVAVTRLIRHKGIGYLIRAYQKIKTDKKLVIVGDASFGDDYVSELKRLAKGNKNIIFVGNQTGRALGELFSNAYLFVQPSEREGLSIALLEAMAYGNAVLISDIPENLEAVGETGFRFRSKDTDSLRRKLKFLINRPKLVEESKVLSRERVRNNYDWEVITDSVKRVYAIAKEEKSRVRGEVRLGRTGGIDFENKSEKCGAVLEREKRVS